MNSSPTRTHGPSQTHPLFRAVFADWNSRLGGASSALPAAPVLADPPRRWPGTSKLLDRIRSRAWNRATTTTDRDRAAVLGPSSHAPAIGQNPSMT